MTPSAASPQRKRIGEMPALPVAFRPPRRAEGGIHVAEAVPSLGFPFARDTQSCPRTRSCFIVPAF